MTPKQLAAHVVRKVSERIQRALGIEPDEEVECPMDPTTAHFEASNEDAMFAIALAQVARDAAGRGDYENATRLEAAALEHLHLAHLAHQIATGKMDKNKGST